VVAKGVETEGQRGILAELGCDELQGYLSAKPMPADALTRWLPEGSGGRPAPDFGASAAMPLITERVSP
jgi:predicted signal transduction protein with EAL and GGDEF domain